ncbi:MAG: PilX N-terminal domain-containing pilus assembly protein [Sedimenticola sp.]
MLNAHNKLEKGSVLITSLLLLTVLTIIGLAGTSSSIFELRMAGNTQSFYDSFQNADAGITAAMSQEGDNFDGSDKSNIFSSGGTNTLKAYITSTVNVDRLFPTLNLACPRESGGSSVGFLECEYYRVESEHDDTATGARTLIFQGVAKEILAQ